MERICRLDARLRTLLGDPSPDPARLQVLLDSLETGLSGEHSARSDSQAIATALRILAAAKLTPTLHPSDSDLVPSLAWERKRAGCVPLVLFWIRMLKAQGVSAEGTLLPGHIVVRLSSGLLLEPLKGGIPRDPGFYDSAFSLGSRPYYAPIRADSNAVLASMLVQAGLLEWKSNQLASAESAFRAAAALCPGLPEAEGNLGLVLVARNRPELALPRLDRALEGDPSNSRARSVRDSLIFQRRMQATP